MGIINSRTSGGGFSETGGQGGVAARHAGGVYFFLPVRFAFIFRWAMNVEISAKSLRSVCENNFLMGSRTGLDELQRKS